MTPTPLLRARLSADYTGRPGVLDNAELTIEAGEIVGMVGESGSGKSTLALSILRLLEFRGGSTRGRLEFRGADLLALSQRQMRSLRGREMGLVLQSPLSALNPALRIGRQITEAWRAHRTGEPDFLELLEMVNLPSDRTLLERYPSQLSVGQAQRVLIAMAILHRPALLIADEPTSALDAVTQSEVLKLFQKLNRELGMAVLYISHDLLSVASLCHRIAILRRGQVVETDSREAIFHHPHHPYTQALIGAIPKLPSAVPDSLLPA